MDAPTAAAVYARISRDRAGEALGVARQEELCRQLAERKGWPVVEVFVDNDLSAYSGKPRPGYEEMCAAIREGRIDAVVVVDQDRLVRQTRELEAFIDMANAHDVALANVSGDLDLSSADGRLTARIRGSVAQHESDIKGERIRREQEQAARRGIPHGGPRPFGYEPGGMEMRESEAALIRNAAARVLAGIPMRSIAVEWNAAGILTSRGNEWTVNSLRVLLTGPRIAGLRQHRGEVVGDAVWPAIIDRTTHERLKALTSRRKRGGRPPKMLLTGLLYCGRPGCGEVLRSAAHHGRGYYKCRSSPGEHRGCQRTSVMADRVEDFLIEAVLHRLSGPKLREALAQAHDPSGDAEAVTRQIAADEEALTELADARFVSRSVTPAGYLSAKAKLEERLAASRAQLDALTSTTVLADLPGSEDALRERWAREADDWRAGTDWRRAVMESVLERVVVKPWAPTNPRVFDGSRLEPVWRV